MLITVSAIVILRVYRQRREQADAQVLHECAKGGGVGPPPIPAPPWTSPFFPLQAGAADGVIQEAKTESGPLRILHRQALQRSGVALASRHPTCPRPSAGLSLPHPASRFVEYRCIRLHATQVLDGAVVEVAAFAALTLVRGIPLLDAVAGDLFARMHCIRRAGAAAHWVSGAQRGGLLQQNSSCSVGLRTAPRRGVRCWHRCMHSWELRRGERPSFPTCQGPNLFAKPFLFLLLSLMVSGAAASQGILSFDAPGPSAGSVRPAAPAWRLF